MARQIPSRAEALRLQRFSPHLHLFSGVLLYPLFTVAVQTHGVTGDDKGNIQEISGTNTLRSNSSCIASA